VFVILNNFNPIVINAGISGSLLLVTLIDSPQRVDSWLCPKILDLGESVREWQRLWLNMVVKSFLTHVQGAYPSIWIPDGAILTCRHRKYSTRPKNLLGASWLAHFPHWRWTKRSNITGLSQRPTSWFAVALLMG